MKKMRWCFSGGHISPPPPLQRKLPNPSTSSLGGTAGPSSSSTEPTSSGDEDQKLSKFVLYFFLHKDMRILKKLSFRAFLLAVSRQNLLFPHGWKGTCCRELEKSNLIVLRISPVVAPKPYLDDANSWSSISDEKKAPERSDRIDSSYGIGDVSWRLQRMGLLVTCCHKSFRLQETYFCLNRTRMLSLYRTNNGLASVEARRGSHPGISWQIEKLDLQ